MTRGPYNAGAESREETVKHGRAIIVGGGIFGVTAALELRRRGQDVVLLDPGPLPHPLAASTDISKVVRLDYGPDEDYTACMERAIEAWRGWNAQWPTPLFHETGVVFLRRAPMDPGTFERESFNLLSRRGHTLQRLDEAEIARRFPAWADGGFTDGYFNPTGGWAESGRVVAQLLEDAREAGVVLREGAAFHRFIERGSRVEGVVVRRSLRASSASDAGVSSGAGRDGHAQTPHPSPGEERLSADEVVLCAGAWTPHLLPTLAGAFRSSGLPVFHLRPAGPDQFRHERFPVFCAAITETGYYGFPLHPSGVVKIANHGPGRVMHPESPERAITEDETRELRRFLARSLPALAQAEIAATRICLYCDTWDGHLWIARDPDREGLTVAAGDSGHAFKLAPVLGALIADAVEGRDSPLLRKFRWRPEIRPPRSEEAARHQE